MNKPKTITFRCPWCNGTCAFKDIHAGKSARCTSCQNHFTIPETEDDKVKKIKPQPVESDGDAISGFYTAALKKSWSIIFSRSSATGLIFVIVLMVIKFMVWNANYTFSLFVPATGKFISIPLYPGKTIGVSAYGLIFWYYMKIIYATAFEIDNFPKPHLGLLVAIICKIAKSLYLALVSVTITQLPTLTAMLIMKITGKYTPEVLIPIAAAGCLVLPMSILMAAISQDCISVLRIDLTITAIRKTLPKYFLVAVISSAVIIGFVLCKNFQPKTLLLSPLSSLLYLTANILLAIIGTYASRALGLLYKHHGGQMQW